MTAFITATQCFCHKVSHKRLFPFFFRGGGETDTFPQPQPEVINWDSDPRQQSLLLVLWSHYWRAIMSRLCREDRMTRFSGHYTGANGSAALPMNGGRGGNTGQGDWLLSCVITGQCSVMHLVNRCMLHCWEVLGTFAVIQNETALGRIFPSWIPTSLCPRIYVLCRFAPFKPKATTATTQLHFHWKLVKCKPQCNFKMFVWIGQCHQGTVQVSESIYTLMELVKSKTLQYSFALKPCFFCCLHVRVWIIFHLCKATQHSWQL